MKIINKNIDCGKPFDWERTSLDYARFRDIYPPEFYEKIISRNLCINGHNILDIGIGTGVLPRNMYHYGANWTAADISENQIRQAGLLSKNMDIKYFAVPAENINFSYNSFDVITACQCFRYFNHEVIMPNFYRMIKREGSILVLYMARLPFEDEITGASENLILKYNPERSISGETIHPISVPDCYKEKFNMAFIMQTFVNSEYIWKIQCYSETDIDISDSLLFNYKEFDPDNYKEYADLIKINNTEYYDAECDTLYT